MRQTLLLVTASFLALAIVGPASAADLGPAPVYRKAPVTMPALYDWSGLYIGINGGGGSDHNCLSGDYCYDATGTTVGGQIGYRWQASNWVFGLEAQGNWADFSGKREAVFVTPETGSSAPWGAGNNTRIDSFGLFTGQVGYAWNNVLLYVRGGAAVVGDKYSQYSFDPTVSSSGTVAGSASETRWGGTVGAGLDIGFAPNWSIGVEYNHIFLSDRNVNYISSAEYLAVSGKPYFDFRNKPDVDMALVRLNYKFGVPAAARY